MSNVNSFKIGLLGGLALIALSTNAMAFSTDDRCVGLLDFSKTVGYTIWKGSARGSDVIFKIYLSCPHYQTQACSGSLEGTVSYTVTPNESYSASLSSNSFCKNGTAHLYWQGGKFSGKLQGPITWTKSDYSGGYMDISGEFIGGPIDTSQINIRAYKQGK